MVSYLRGNLAEHGSPGSWVTACLPSLVLEIFCVIPTFCNMPIRTKCRNYMENFKPCEVYYPTTLLHLCSKLVDQFVDVSQEVQVAHTSGVVK